MRRLQLCFTVLLVIALCAPPSLQARPVPDEEEVYFSPHGGCTAAVVDNLVWAEKYVLVQAYSFTSQPIADALIAAHKRGVEVKVLLDKSQLHGKGSKLDSLVEGGVPVLIDKKHAIAHNKVMIIDGVTVLTGSFNFTNAAEDKNAENLLVLHDKSLAKKYRDNWNKHSVHSEAYSPHKPGGAPFASNGSKDTR